MKYSPEVLRIHRSAPVADAHSHALINMTYLGRDMGRRNPAPRWYNPLQNMIDRPRAREGGVKALTFTVYVSGELLSLERSLDQTKQALRAYDRMIRRYPELVEQPRRREDLDRLESEGKIAALLAIEGGHSLGGRLELVERYKKRGVYYLTLTHFVHNGIAAAAMDPRARPYGLSGFGREVVAELERVGILPDVAHCTDRAFEEVMAAARGTVICSHTGCRSFCAKERNMSDDQIRAIARTGGFIGIMFLPTYLKKRKIRGTVADVVDSIEHVIGLVGPDAVGIGSDMDGYIWSVRGLKDISEFPSLTREMLRRGYPEDTIRKVLGENLIRLWSKTLDGS
jgi:membrane dipeptidase